MHMTSQVYGVNQVSVWIPWRLCDLSRSRRPAQFEWIHERELLGSGMEYIAFVCSKWSLWLKDDPSPSSPPSTRPPPSFPHSHILHSVSSNDRCGNSHIEVSLFYLYDLPRDSPPRRSVLPCCQTGEEIELCSVRLSAHHEAKVDWMSKTCRCSAFSDGAVPESGLDPG